MKTIRDFDLSKKTVLIRCDFNVPMKDGKILDDTRIRKALDTIEYAMDKNAKVVLLSHLGKVKEESDKQKQTLLPVQKRLEENLLINIYLITIFKFYVFVICVFFIIIIVIFFILAFFYFLH